MSMLAQPGLARHSPRVGRDFPHVRTNPSDFYSTCSSLCSEAVKAGITLPSEFLNEFATADATHLLDVMKTCFHVSGTVSPLVILNPSKWADLKMGRDHLLTVRLLCSNPKFFLTVLLRYSMH